METNKLKIRFESIEYTEDRNKELIEKIIKVANEISETTRRSRGDFVVYGNAEFINQVYGNDFFGNRA